MKAPGTMTFLWTCFQFVFVAVPLVTCYGFRNCIQSYETQDSYNCVYRALLDVQPAVSDLPNNTRYLNLSLNYIEILQTGSFSHLPLLLKLRLDQNKLQNIQPGAFDNLTALQTMNLSFNVLSSLHRDVFKGLENLTYLFLDNNSLVTIDIDLFRSLVKLDFLDLSSNNIDRFDELVGSIHLLNLGTLIVCNNNLTTLNHSHDLPISLRRLYICKNDLQELDCDKDFFIHVKDLDLSYNNLTSSSLEPLNWSNIVDLNIGFNRYFDIFKFIDNSNVPRGGIDYSGFGLNDTKELSELCTYLKGTNITTLSLQGNNIKHLGRDNLSNCSIMKSVDLSRNRLKNVACLQFLNVSEFEILIVEHNLLKQLTNCNNDRKFLKLSFISFQYNRIWSVNDYAFSFAPNLQTLNLNMNNIIFMESKSFSGLTKLKQLRLDNNLIPDLYTNSFMDLRELQVLNLRNNRIAVIFNNIFQNLGNLTTLDLGGNKISHLEPESFNGLQSLTKLYLDGNMIKTIGIETFHSIENTLEVLDLKFNLLKFDTSNNHCSPFANLCKVYDLKLQNQQPYGLTIIPHGFFKGLISLRALYLSQNRLTNLHANVFQELTQLTYLNLAEDCNGVQNLPDGIFDNLPNLHVLVLENICLQTLNPLVFSSLTSLKKLQLTKNALHYVNTTILDNMTSLKYLDIRKCPITCTCANQFLKPWLNHSRVQVIHPYDMSCPLNPDSYFHEFDTNICDKDLKVTYFAVSFTTVLLLIIAPIVYSKSYWRIKYNYFLFVAWLHERWKSDKELYKYDAFVSYNICDEEWVYKTMLPTLESRNPSKALRLCLHHRDFQLGRYIIDNIVDSIHNSRKTICVVSRSYLRSEWCSLEMQLASYKLFDEMRDVLVLILLEDIPDRELTTYHRMRKVMLKKTYISWPSEPEAQKLFWAKLLKVLRTSSFPETTIDYEITSEEASLVEMV
uniref:TIR domain-containing protein n=1 Tax=Leptobrachium leishanense TaxID=445787 RepID=A0A8C5N0M4_9ANUR